MFGSPLSTRLERSSRILVAGAGGGSDVYAALPLALSLREAGKEVHLANLSFSHLDALALDVWLFEDVAEIRPDTEARDWSRRLTRRRLMTMLPLAPVDLHSRVEAPEGGPDSPGHGTH